MATSLTKQFLQKAVLGAGMMVAASPQARAQSYPASRFVAAQQQCAASTDCTIDGDTLRWSRLGQVHRDDGPAIITIDGDTLWVRSGKLHRDDGPAAITADGTALWYRHGKLHRTDGPAIIYADGSEAWFVNGQRADAPAPRTAQFGCSHSG